jgi:hypothetical protein
MTTLRGAIGITVAVLFLAVTLSAQTTKKEEVAGVAKVTTEKITGEVVQVEGNHLLARMPGGQYRMFTIQPGRQFIIDGQSKQLSDLRPGTVLTATATTTTASVTERTTTITSGTVWFVSGNKLIVTLDNGENREFTVPDDFKFNVEGNKEATVRDLRKGMKISATKIVSEPRTQITTDVVVTGQAPK